MKLIHGDCLEKLRDLPTSTVDCVVTDPPYGWRFMGKAWDTADILLKSRQAKRPGETYVGADGVTRQTRADMSMAAGKYDQSLVGNQAFMFWTKDWAEQALRVLKPGGHMLVFCGPRTYHAMAMGVEMAGFEIRDQLQWLFGSGFPKSHNIGDGRGTALKPANEPIVLARKPLEKNLTVAQNILKWGTGALNIDGTRIGYASDNDAKAGRSERATTSKGFQAYAEGEHDALDRSDRSHITGRWPANLLLDEDAAALLDEQSGDLKGPWGKESDQGSTAIFGGAKSSSIGKNYAGQSGGASRFFYVAKASKRERNAGLEGMPEKNSAKLDGGEYRRSGQTPGKGIDHTQITAANHHPTVKPIKLMEYLCKLICPPGGIVLDPFMGSGTTGCAAVKLGFQFIGIEREIEYVEIAKRRIEHWQWLSEPDAAEDGQLPLPLEPA